MYQVLPSQVMRIDDDYTAYCFDEACAFIMSEINQGKDPNFKKFEIDKKVKGKSFKDFSSYFATIK